MRNNVSKQVLLSVIGVAVLVIAVIGVSFAFFIEANYGNINNNSADVVFQFKDGDTFNLINHSPISSTEGKTLMGEGQVFTFTISGKTDEDVYYIIEAVPGEEEKDRQRFKDSEVFVYIKSDDVDGVTFTPNGSFGTSGQALGSSEVILGTGVLSSKNHKEKKFEVRMWIDDSVVSVGDSGTYSLTDLDNMYYSMKIKVRTVPKNSND